MRVVITEARIMQVGTCGLHVTSPYWNSETKELVYEDWAEAMEHLLTLEKGIDRVKWHVHNRLVPTTKDELRQRLKQLKEERDSNG